MTWYIRMFGLWLSVRRAETLLYVCCSDCAVAATCHLDSCLTHRRNTQKHRARRLQWIRVVPAAVLWAHQVPQQDTTQDNASTSRLCFNSRLQQSASPAGPCEHLQPYVGPPHAHVAQDVVYDKARWCHSLSATSTPKQRLMQA